MQADPEQENLKELNRWADKVACPACYGALDFKDAAVACTKCGRVYPIVDGIPVLIAERAENSPV
jgi:hypothetical protein